MTDPIADYLTRLRNAIKANHSVVEIPASNLKKEITKVLFDKGYILNYKFRGITPNQGVIKIALKYNPETRESAITKLEKNKHTWFEEVCEYWFDASRDERLRRCNSFDIKGCDNRQGSEINECRRRSIVLRLLIEEACHG